jgi:hypothetical protein
MQNIRYIPLGFQQISVGSTATHITVSAGATVALFGVDSANVRYRDDGTAPTASVGTQIVSAQQPFEYWGTLSALQFIAVSGSPVLNISYYSISG